MRNSAVPREKRYSQRKANPLKGKPIEELISFVMEKNADLMKGLA